MVCVSINFATRHFLRGYSMQPTTKLGRWTLVIFLLFFMSACGKSEHDKETSKETMGPEQAPPIETADSEQTEETSVPINTKKIDEAIATWLKDQPKQADQAIDKAPTPHIAFQSPGFLLARDSAQGIEVETVNVDELQLELIRVPKVHLSNFVFGNHNLSNTTIAANALRQILDADATVAWQGSVVINHTADESKSTMLPVQEVMHDLPPGLFALVASNSADTQPMLPSRIDGWARDWSRRWDQLPIKWILNTNISIAATQHEKGMLVNVRALDSAEPLVDAGTQIYTRNGEVVFSQSSDAEGWIEVPEPVARGRRAHRPSHLVVEHGEDFAFLSLVDNPLDLSQFNIGGRLVSKRADVYLFSDRGIYRPREKVYVHALVRDQDGRNTVKGAFDIALFQPNGRQQLRKPIELKDLGSLSTVLELPNDAVRGVWRVAVMHRGESTSAAQIEIDVQDFIPERMKVELLPLSKGVLGEAVAFELQADYQYGAPANAAGVEADATALTVRGAEVPLPDWDGFLFGDALQRLPSQSIETQTQPTDAEGRATVALVPTKPTFPETNNNWRAAQPKRVLLNVGVQEPGGRTTKASSSTFMVSPVPAIAIRPNFRRFVSSDVGAEYEVRMLSPNLTEGPTDNLRWGLYRIENKWQFDRNSRRWRRQEVNTPFLAEGRVETDSEHPNRGIIKLDPQDWGRYVIVVSDPEQRVYVRQTFFSGWRSSADSRTPDLLELHTDQQEFSPGDVVKVGMDAPFAGQGTVTVWTDEPIYSRNIRFDEGRTVFELPSSDAWTPGVYVVISAIRPLGEVGSTENNSLSIDQYLPARSMGVLHLQANSERQLQVTLPPDSTLTPRQTRSLEFSVPELANESAYAIVQVVDEGILQLTNFSTPDPGRLFFAKRALLADFYDPYNALIRGDGPISALRSGGDTQGGSLGSSLDAIPTRSVVLHAGPVALDANGRAQVPLEIPDFNGRLRTMVTVWTDERFGSAEGYWVVRDPVVAEAIFPRFVGPGDDVEAIIHLDNTTQDQLRLTLDARGDGAVATAFEAVELVLDGGESRQLALPLTGRHVGVGDVFLNLEVEGLQTLERQWSLSVQYLGTPIALGSEPQAFPPGQTVSFDLGFTRSLQAEGRSGYFLVEQANPFLLPEHSAASLVNSLINYRWTCSEQTASQTTPLLLAYEIDPVFTTRMIRQALRNADPEAWLQARVDRILARQSRNGAIGLWSEGDGLVDPSLAAQLIEMLAYARSAQLFVPEDALTSGFQWAVGLIQESDEPGPLKNAAMARMLNAMAPHSPRLVRLARVLADEAQSMDLLSATYLALALGKFGDEARASELMSIIKELPENSGYAYRPYYASKGAQMAQMAANLHELGLDTEAQSLLNRFRVYIERQGNGYRLSTNEQGHLLRAQLMAADQSPAEVIWKGDRYSSRVGSMIIPLDADDLGPEQTSLSITSAFEKPLMVGLEMEAIPERESVLQSQRGQMSIERHVCSLDGDKHYVDGLNHARINDRFMVMVDVTLNPIQNPSMRQLMIIDPMPAGFQIESIITDSIRNEWYPWLPVLTRADVKEAQDTGFFAARLITPPRLLTGPRRARPKTLRFAYIARATTAGEYLATQAVAEDMYDSTVRASSGGRPVQVWSANVQNAPTQQTNAQTDCRQMFK